MNNQNLELFNRIHQLFDDVPAKVPEGHEHAKSPLIVPRRDKGKSYCILFAQYKTRAKYR